MYLTPDQEKLSAILQARLINLTVREGMALVGPTQGNRCEAWRLLSQRYDSMTDARFASLVISVVGYKVANNADMQAAPVHWNNKR